MKTSLKFWTASLVLSGAVVALALQNKAIQVSLEGKTISKSGRMIDGKLYIPAADAAKAFGYKLEHKPNTVSAKLVPAGGANPEQGAEGPIGEWIFNGITRLMVMDSPDLADGKLVYTLEVRNGEKSPKNYKFGFTEAQILVFDADGAQIQGALVNLNQDYSVDIKPATPYRVKVGFKMVEGFEPARMVLRIPTQIQGKPQRVELFRVDVAVKA